MSEKKGLPESDAVEQLPPDALEEADENAARLPDDAETALRKPED